MKSLCSIAICLSLVTTACSEPATSYKAANPRTGADEPGETRAPDVIFVPTPQPVVERMLELAEPRRGDVLYDLGSGDGRIPIIAARDHGIRAVGIDIDPQRIAESRKNAREAGVEDRVTFRQEDMFESDIGEASVVTLYLLDSLNEKLKPKLLAELKPGTRIVSQSFDMGEWEPERKSYIHGRNVYLWTVPERGSAAR